MARLTLSRIGVRLFFLLPMFAVFGCAKEGTKGPPKVDAAPPLSEDTIAAWKRHHGKPGWFATSKKGRYSGFVESPNERRETSICIPGFYFEKRDATFLAEIHEPSTPFGLSFKLFCLTDENIKHLARFRNLQWLEIVDNKITDASLKEIGRLNQLKGLGLRNEMNHRGPKRFMPITDGGVAELKTLTNLEILNLAWNEIDGAGLEQLAGMTNLTDLSLMCTLITDDNLRHVAAFNNLRSLNLGATSISDAGLKHLSGLTELEVLYIYETKVTDAGIAVLQKQIPQTKIWHKARPLAHEED